MRHLRLLLALPIVPALVVAAACGGSGSNPASPADSGAGAFDGSMIADAIGPESDAASDAARVPESSTTGDAGDAGETNTTGACAPVTGTFTEAQHAPLPTMAEFGGPIVASPYIVTFTFQDTPNAAAIASFGATLASTPWFLQVTKDYCGPNGGACITAGPPGTWVQIASNGGASYFDSNGFDAGAGSGTDLNAFINQQIAAAVAAKQIPAPDANAIYMFYFPSTSTITGNLVGTSCSGYGGYHEVQTYSDGKTPIYYAILPDCAAGTSYELPSVTVAASHELVEATTDPEPNVDTAWYLDLTNVPDAAVTPAQFRNDPWISFGYGEIGDNCENTSYDTLDGGNVVQRIWSASAAAQGHDPCVPVPPGEVYFNASSDKAIYVANVGDSFMVDVSPFSDGPRTSWQLDAVDRTPTGATTADGGMLTYLQLEWMGGTTRSDGISSLTCVNDGSQAKLKVTLLADPAADLTLQQSQEWPEAIGDIISVDASQTQPTIPGYQTVIQSWPFGVVTPATAAMVGIPSGGAAQIRHLRTSQPVRPMPKR